MTNSNEVHIRRAKLRRIFETEFSSINKSIKLECQAQGVEPFFIKYSPHLLDRAIQREIDETYVFELFKKLVPKVKEVLEVLVLPPLPDVEEQLDQNVTYRPVRLEITDRTLWLGMTMDPIKGVKGYGMMCRMAFVNKNRLEGKISTKVIDL